MLITQAIHQPSIDAAAIVALAATRKMEKVATAIVASADAIRDELKLSADPPAVRSARDTAIGARRDAFCALLRCSMLLKQGKPEEPNKYLN
jgi:hypothetical protein